MKLQVQLTDDQLKVIVEAIQLWEAEPAVSGMSLSIFRTVLRHKDESEEEARERTRLEIEKAKLEVNNRKRMSMAIQLAIMDILANPKEHSVDDTSHT